MGGGGRAPPSIRVVSKYINIIIIIINRYFTTNFKTCQVGGERFKQRFSSRGDK